MFHSNTLLKKTTMKFKLYFIVILVLAILNSCSDEFITSDLYGTEDLDNYFTSEEECESFVNGLYVGFAHWESWWKNYLRLTNQTATDDAWMGNLQQDNSDYYAFAFYTITASNTPDALYNFYYYKYQNISSANIAIANIPSSGIDEDAQDLLIGQAKFFRAFSYWELVQNFGDVVLFTDPVGTEDLDVDRTDKTEVYEQIVTDLKEAAQVLPKEWDSENTGRVTSWACKALLARTYLFMEDYENAYAYADSVINMGSYSLEPDFVDIWSCYNHNGVESIFEIQTSSDQTYAVGAYTPVVVNGRGEIWDDDETDKAMDGWGWCVPTSNLESAYKEEGDSIRLKSTIIRLGDSVYGDSIDNPDYQYDPDYNKSCRTWRKYYVPIAIRQSLTNVAGYVPLDMILLRLGEMYLTRSEASYHLGYESQALADINTLRARVDLDGKSGLSGDDLLYAIWKERRMEMASEGLRLYDLRRQIDPVENKARIAVIMGDNGTFVQYNASSTDYYENLHTSESQTEGAEFTEGKNELWPIPQSEIDRSSTLSQNSGY
jgi:hypothetical protein